MHQINYNCHPRLYRHTIKARTKAVHRDSTSTMASFRSNVHNLTRPQGRLRDFCHASRAAFQSALITNETVGWLLPISVLNPSPDWFSEETTCTVACFSPVKADTVVFPQSQLPKAKKSFALLNCPFLPFSPLIRQPRAHITPKGLNNGIFWLSNFSPATIGSEKSLCDESGSDDLSNFKFGCQGLPRLVSI